MLERRFYLKTRPFPTVATIIHLLVRRRRSSKDRNGDPDVERLIYQSEAARIITLSAKNLRAANRGFSRS